MNARPPVNVLPTWLRRHAPRLSTATVCAPLMLSLVLSPFVAMPARAQPDSAAPAP